MNITEHHSQEQIGVTLFPEQQCIDFFHLGETLTNREPFLVYQHQHVIVSI